MILDLTAIGNLGQDATIKDFNGKKYIAFNLGCSEKFTDQNGVQNEKTTWISCLKLVRNEQSALAGFLKKGTQVYIRGRVSCKAFKRQDNQYDASLNCNVYDLQLLSSKQPASQNQPATATNQQPMNPAPMQQPQFAPQPQNQPTPQMQAAQQMLQNAGFTAQLSGDDDLPF